MNGEAFFFHSTIKVLLLKLHNSPKKALCPTVQFTSSNCTDDCQFDGIKVLMKFINNKAAIGWLTGLYIMLPVYFLIPSPEEQSDC